MGGTMRLGVYPAKLSAGSLAARLYGEPVVYERHRHRWEVNNRYRSALIDAGMLASGVSPDDRLVEIVEISDHPYFIASQFHPEFTSRPDNPNPLFAGLVEAALAYKQGESTECGRVSVSPSGAIGGSRLRLSHCRQASASQTPLVRLEEVDLETPGGEVVPRTVVRFGGAVSVVPVDR